jgi:proteasome lid subunit RPN8/RPN11
MHDGADTSGLHPSAGRLVSLVTRSKEFPMSIVPSAAAPVAGPPVAVQMSAEVFSRLLARAQELNAAGLKAYGLLAGDPGAPGFPFRAVEAVILDPHRNRRNDAEHRAAFHAQGSYFRAFEDAGFVADPADLLRCWRRIEDAGLEPVAVFHVHRRQPANFSSIDYRLHKSGLRLAFGDFAARTGSAGGPTVPGP